MAQEPLCEGSVIPERPDFSPGQSGELYVQSRTDERVGMAITNEGTRPFLLEMVRQERFLAIRGIDASTGDELTRWRRGSFSRRHAARVWHELTGDQVTAYELMAGRI